MIANMQCILQVILPLTGSKPTMHTVGDIMDLPFWGGSYYGVD